MTDVSNTSGLPLTGQTSGAVVADFDRDGWADLLIGRHDLVPEAYRNLGGCEFELMTDFGQEMYCYDHHATVADDFDGDGELDLYFVVGAHRGRAPNPNALYLGANHPPVDSAPHFGVEDRFGRGRGAILLDLDRDSGPDLVVMNFRTAPRCFEFGGAVPIPDSITELFGIPAADDLAVAGGAHPRRSEYITDLLPLDLASDGLTDVLLFGGGLPLKLMRATGSGWSLDVEAIPPDAYLPAPVGAARADWNGDLEEDLFLFYGDEDRPSHIRVDRRHRLLAGRDGRFVDETPEELQLSGIGSAAVATDLDLDGRMDLVILSTHRERRSSRLLVAMQREGPGRHARFDILYVGGPMPGLANGIVAEDLDGDGDLDVVVLIGDTARGSSGGGVRIFRNDRANNGNSLRVEFPHGGQWLPYGSVVTVVAGGRTQRQIFWPRQVSGSSYRGNLCFGLGDADTIDLVDIRWPDGRKERHRDLEVNSLLRLIPESAQDPAR